MKKLYKWIEDKPTIHSIKLLTFNIVVHNFVDCENKWFLSCNRFNILMFDLKITDLKKAKIRAISLIKDSINYLQKQVDKL